MYQKTVCFDFDGVINSYVSGWKGIDVIPDPPVEGIGKEIEKLRSNNIKVVVYSTRCKESKGIAAIWAYLKKHKIMVDDVCVEKPIAYAYIDDRAICFNGNTEGLANRVLNFENWLNKDEDAVNEYLTNLSAQICDVFENLLESEDITIPDDQREGAEEEARLFGMKYYEVEDSIKDILRKNFL